MRKLILIAATSALALPGLAHAAAVPPAGDTDSKTVAIVGTAPPMCFGGTLNGSGSYDLGVLIDLTTGQLRNDLAADPKVLLGSLCTSRSTITINATPLVAQNATATPPTGFSRSVDYTATATGWTTTPASFNTAAASNAAATQSRASAFTGDITVAISGFSTTGGNSLRLVAELPAGAKKS